MIRLGAVALRRVAPSALLVGSLGATVLGACTTDHDSLARRPSTGGAGGGGNGGGGFGAGGVGNTGNMAQAGRDNPDDEPLGDSVLTVVNGVVDAPSVRLCFARRDDEGNVEPLGAPLPELPYGGTTVVTELDDLSFERDVLVPWVLTGDFSAIDDASCAEVLELAREAEGGLEPGPGAAGAGGQGGVGSEGGAASGEGGAGGEAPAPRAEKAPLRARQLPGVPAGTVANGRSVLMALSGCVGADSGALSVAVCGEAREPGEPTLTPVVVKVSRSARFDRVGLQGLHAATAIGTVDVRVVGDGGAMTISFASGIGLGELAPRPADTRFSPVELGIETAGFGLQAFGAGGVVLARGTWSDVAAFSGLEKVQSGRSYTAVLLGPQPPRVITGAYNPPAIVLVDNDPTRQ